MDLRGPEDLEDPYPLEDLGDLHDPAHPDLKIKSNSIRDCFFFSSVSLCEFTVTVLTPSSQGVIKNPLVFA